jgi:hypothetical protein
MKPKHKYVSLIIFFCGLIGFSACNVLDVEPFDKITSEQAFKDKAGIEKGILGSYAELQSLSYYGRTYLIFSDLAADNLSHPTDATAADYAEVDNNYVLPENGAIDGIWTSIYSAINAANSVIVKVPDMTDMTDEEKTTALGELYFLRALNHFNLMNYFGAIPIKTEPTVGTDGLDAPRDEVSDVYAQIISDLTYAETHLEASSSTKTRASKYAATALLARVYLYEKDYEKAYEKANSVITEGGYELVDYSDIFADDESNTEAIFNVAFDETSRNRIAEYNYPKTLNGRYEVKPDASLISAYESGDKRLDASIAYSGSNPYAVKYNDLSLGDKDVIVLRLAEMYLIRAEAEAYLTSPDLTAIKNDINTIRLRAGLADTDATTIAGLLLAIEKERRTEFAFEGQRWFDLVRTNRAIDVLPNVTKSYQMLFPIPLSEINTNTNMTQNPLN